MPAAHGQDHQLCLVERGFKSRRFANPNERTSTVNERAYNFCEAHEEIKRLNDQLEKTRRLYQEMTDAALQWREKFVRLEGQANTLAGQAQRATDLADGFANQAQAADHCVGVLRSELDAAKAQVRTLQDRVANVATQGHRDRAALEEKQQALDMALAYGAPDVAKLREEIAVLQHALNEARKRADTHVKIATDHATVIGNLRAEIHRKDKDLSLLRSELERSRVAHADTNKEFDKVRMNFRHTATEVNEAYLRGRRDGQSERDNAAMLANDDAFDRGRLVGRAEARAAVENGCPCTLPIKDIHLDHRKISGEFINRAIDLYDLLREISEEDPHAVQFRVRNPAMTGQIVALTHALRDFHNAPCPSSEG